jgi:uncharacterized membrane protein
MDSPATLTCAITGRTLSPDEAVPCAGLRPSLLRFIQKRFPAVTQSSIVANDALPDLKAAYVEESLADEIGEITHLERAVIRSLEEHEVISEPPEDAAALASRTLGERLADHLASFGGSWTFILTFGAFLTLWIFLNTAIWRSNPPDPYPYILLNLLLSCIAALQAPVIMMSQRRQESRDRNRAEQDYRINLKAELEIRHLHEKLDHLLYHHSQRLLEIQTIQTDLLSQLLDAHRLHDRIPAPDVKP